MLRCLRVPACSGIGVVAMVAAVVGLPGSVAGGEDALGWRVRFVDNPQLPSKFRQGQAERPDGSVITYFVGGADESRDAQKPLLVYLDGSGAQSLFFKLPDGRVATSVFGLVMQRAGNDYHVVGVEKRGVGFGDGGGRGSGEGASPEYTRHATLAERAADVRLMLDALLGDPMVDASRAVLVGHSEGADVAAAVAAEDPRVTHVAFLSGGGAAQLFDFFILRRKMFADQGASPEAIERAIVDLEEEIRQVLADPDSEEKLWMGHAYKRWSTFATQASADSLVKSKAKLFLGHGTADTSVPMESFDFLVVELLRHGRRDVTIRRYAGADHGFSQPGEPPSGEPFVKVLDQVLAWADGAADGRTPDADDEVVVLHAADSGAADGGKAAASSGSRNPEGDAETTGNAPACNPSALDETEQARRGELERRLKDSMRMMRGLDDGYELELQADAETIAATAEFITLKRRCCPFLDFELTLAANGGPIQLRITGPDGSKPLIKASLMPGS